MTVILVATLFPKAGKADRVSHLPISLSPLYLNSPLQGMRLITNSFTWIDGRAA
jgi:hypothetical protein